MSGAEARRALAESFLGAYESKRALPPPTAQFDGLTIDDAYDIQQRQIDARVAAGAVVKGYKVGLTSQAMQDMLGVHEPDFGHLLSDMFLPEGTPIKVSDYLQPRIEPEIAFVMGAELAGPGVTPGAAAKAVDHVVASLELIDSRVADWRITLVDTIADNASSAGVILGSKPVRLADVDLASINCRFIVNSTIFQTGVGAAVMGSPLDALVWLANTLGARGVAFKPGDVIMPGSLTAAHDVVAGTNIEAAFSDLGSVFAAFVAGANDE